MAGQLRNDVPGIVLFLEIRGVLVLRRGCFLLGCQLAAILGLLAHPGGHLIRQAGEHYATFVDGVSSVKFTAAAAAAPPVCFSLSLLILERNDDVLT